VPGLTPASLERAACFGLGLVVVVMMMMMVRGLGSGVSRVVMVMMVMVPAMQRGDAGNNAVVEGLHARTDTPGDGPFLAPGRAQQSEQRLQEQHVGNLPGAGCPLGEGSRSPGFRLVS
jgi:hypothetical protein